MINKIHNESCLVTMAKISDDFIDLTVTSPPYDNLRTYDGILDWGEHIWKPAIQDLFRITKQGGVLVWVVGDATIKGSETGTSFKQALWANECGFNLHDTMIWNKGTFTAVGALVSRYAPVFEYMFVFTKGKLKTFNPIKDRKNKWSGTKAHGTIRQTNGDTKRITTHNKKTIPEFGQRFNIWEIPNAGDRNQKHPATFPEQLAEDHILSWSNEGDIILDPFAGSGTTLKMANLNKRNFIGSEISKNYCDIAEKRLSQNL